jgi:hypothetical protein
VNKNYKEMFDLSLLPQKAQDELKDFYQFLVERYGFKNEEKSDLESRKKRIQAFFDKYNLDLSNFKFNRDEIYNR